jgi:hypothetical protein
MDESQVNAQIDQVRTDFAAPLATDLPPQRAPLVARTA